MKLIGGPFDGRESTRTSPPDEWIEWPNTMYLKIKSGILMMSQKEGDGHQYNRFDSNSYISNDVDPLVIDSYELEYA